MGWTATATWSAATPPAVPAARRAAPKARGPRPPARRRARTRDSPAADSRSNPEGWRRRRSPAPPWTRAARARARSQSQQQHGVLRRAAPVDTHARAAGGWSTQQPVGACRCRWAPLVRKPVHVVMCHSGQPPGFLGAVSVRRARRRTAPAYRACAPVPPAGRRRRGAGASRVRGLLPPAPASRGEGPSTRRPAAPAAKRTVRAQAAGVWRVRKARGRRRVHMRIRFARATRAQGVLLRPARWRARRGRRRTGRVTPACAARQGRVRCLRVVLTQPQWRCRTQATHADLRAPLRAGPSPCRALRTCVSRHGEGRW